jgi:Tfp pilus assembly protein PilO
MKIKMLAAVVLLVPGVFFLSSIPSLRTRISSAQTQLASLQEENRKLSEVLSSIKTIESNLELLQTAIPTADDVPTLMTQLENLGKSSGVTVQHLGFGSGVKESAPPGGEAGTEAVKKERYQKVSLTVVVTGTYAALEAFLKNLEQTSRVINVTTLRFSPSQEGESGEAKLSATLGVSAYYLPAAAAPSVGEVLTLDLSSSDYIELIKKVKTLRIYRPEISP